MRSQTNELWSLKLELLADSNYETEKNGTWLQIGKISLKHLFDKLKAQSDLIRLLRWICTWIATF